MADVMSRGAAANLLRGEYSFDTERAKRVLEIANEFGRKAEPCDGGFVHVVYKGWSKDWPFTERFAVYDHTGKITRPGVAHTAGMDYTKSTDRPRQSLDRKKTDMPPRGRKAAAAPVEPEEQEANGAGEFDAYLTKDLSQNMVDYGDWFHENVTDVEDLGRTDPFRLLALGSTLYTKYQKSDAHQALRAEKKAAREADEDEAEEAPAKPAPRGRPKPSAPAAEAPAPARRGRSKAAASAGAPY